MIWQALAFGFIALVCSPARAFDREATKNYAMAWWNTDVNPADGKVDHVNGPLAQPTTGPYMFYYVGGKNAGNNTIPKEKGSVELQRLMEYFAV